MNKFDLIETLQSVTSTTDAESTIGYQMYDVDVSGHTITVGIPLRETENFEKFMAESANLTALSLRSTLRKFRGIRG